MTDSPVRDKPPAATTPSGRTRSGSERGSAQADTAADAGTAPRFATDEPPPKFSSMRAPPPEGGQRRSTGRERILAHRMQVAAGAFWVWLSVAALIALAALPINDDADTMDALNEVSAFGTAFDQASLERTLRAHAAALAGVGLPKVAQRVGGRGVPKLVAGEGASPIAPYAKLDLASLANIEALTASSAKLAIEVPTPDSLAEGLSWRLSRLAQADRYVLQSVVLSDGGCTAADLAREQELTRLRNAVLQARAQTTAAEQKQLAAEKVYEVRRKWKGKGVWKAIAQANEKRVETKATLDQAQRQLMEAGTAYDATADAALRLQPGAAGEAGCRLALATVAPKGSNQTTQFHVPTRVDARSIAAPKIEGASFPVAKRVGLWSVIKDSSPTVAVAQLRSRFSWHNRYTELLGFKLGGMTVLQLLPLLNVLVLLLLLRSCRRVSATYNPFDPPMIANLPNVGFRSRELVAALLGGLPVLGCALCAWALLRIDQLPVVPVLCGAGTLGLGINAYFALRRLLDLREAIMQSHTHPPASR